MIHPLALCIETSGDQIQKKMPKVTIYRSQIPRYASGDVSLNSHAMHKPETKFPVRGTVDCSPGVEALRKLLKACSLPEKRGVWRKGLTRRPELKRWEGVGRG